jgi:multiple sugar transport system permease protein
MIWQCGTAMVIYLGALKAVPGHYYEAAEIDGLNRLGQFMKITIPLISPTIFFRAIMDLIFGLMIFIPGLVLPEGNVPGGPGNASRFYALHLYEKAFQRFNLGEASTLATILIIISFLITFLIMKTSERFVHYEV